MKHYLLILIHLTTFYFNSTAQNQSIDSVLNHISSTRYDTSKVEAFNELAWVLRSTNSQLALSYADSAIDLSRNIDYKAGEATGHVRSGLIKMLKGDLSGAKTDYEYALQIENSIQNTFGIARASNQLSLIYNTLGSVRQSIKYARKAVEQLRVLRSDQPLASALNNLGEAYIETAEYDSALIFLNESLDIRERLNRKSEIAKSYLNLGYLFEKTKDYDRSIEYSALALDIYTEHDDQTRKAQAHENLGNAYYKKGNLAKAEENYLESLGIRSSLTNQTQIANSYSNLSIVYKDQKKFSDALNYATLSLNLRIDDRDTAGIIISNINLGNLKLRIDKKSEAEHHYLKAFQLAEKKDLLLRFPEVLSHLTDLYSKLNKPDEALKFSLLYGEVKDSIEIILKRTKDLELEIQRQKDDNAQLIQQEKYARLESHNKGLVINFLIIGIILLLLIFSILIAYFKLVQKKKLAEKNSKIREKEIEELLKKQELDSIGAMIEGQEIERKRIARDLHDRLGSMLSVVKIHFKSVEDNLELLQIKNRKQYEKANQLLDDACDEVRKVAHDMVSGVLMKFGLISALKNLSSSVESTGQLKMTLIDFGFDERLDYDYEINIYRIIQELLSNVLKHAQAKEMTIQLLKKEDSINITVEDDGIGFDQETALSKQGLGIKNIESRINKLGGDFTIDSGKGAGTTFTIDLKLQKNRND